MIVNLCLSFSVDWSCFSTLTDVLHMFMYSVSGTKSATEWGPHNHTGQPIVRGTTGIKFRWESRMFPEKWNMKHTLVRRLTNSPFSYLFIYCISKELDTGGKEFPLEEEMATHSSILAGEFQGQKSLAGYSPWVAKSWTRLSGWARRYITQNFYMP